MKKVIRGYAFGGEEDEEQELKAPKGYKPSTLKQRQEWNRFLDYLQTKGIQGSPELDKKDMKLWKTHFSEYKKANPKAPIDEDFVPIAQYEGTALRKGMPVPKVASKELANRFNTVLGDKWKNTISPVDGWLGSITSSMYYPGISESKDTPYFGEDYDAYEKWRSGKDSKSVAKFAGGGWVDMAKNIPALSDTIIDLIENNPNARTDQPIVNATTMKTMVSPYTQFAFGGESEGMDEETLARLQEIADENGITVEEVIQMLNQQQGGDQEPEMAQDEGELEEVDEPMEEEGHGGDFFALGGKAGKNLINIEDNEVLETPDGKVVKANGAVHEKGGMNVRVPGGTKIYSDRISIAGKTMQERKLSREKKLSKLEKLIHNNKYDLLVKKTYERTQNNLAREDAEDMMIQQIASRSFPNPKKYAGGTGPLGIEDPKIKKGINALIDQYLQTGADDLAPTQLDPTIGARNMNRTMNIPDSTANPLLESNSAYKMTPGDWVGLSGSAFNAIAPMVNTLRQRKTDKPNINRYRGFGREAIQANDDAQDFASGLRNTAMTDLSTSNASSKFRNRNSAMGINTLRALDAVTDMGTDRNRNSVNDTFAKQMIGLLGQRGQLTNIKDQMEMRGETMRDMEDKADKDAYFTAAAQNIANMGNSVQDIGRNLNISKGNQVDANLLSQLSRYGLTFDEYGNLINK